MRWSSSQLWTLRLMGIAVDSRWMFLGIERFNGLEPHDVRAVYPHELVLRQPRLHFIQGVSDNVLLPFGEDLLVLPSRCYRLPGSFILSQIRSLESG